MFLKKQYRIVFWVFKAIVCVICTKETLIAVPLILDKKNVIKMKKV